MKEKKVKLNYLVGTMIEIPRAALVADEIAQDAEFFSFGTNDLTQTTLGMSRDDSGTFLPAYAELDIIATNPFASIDQTGRRQTDGDAARSRPQDAAEDQARHLWRTRRRTEQREVLPSARFELRELQSLPRADRATRSRAGCAREVARALTTRFYFGLAVSYVATLSTPAPNFLSQPRIRLRGNENRPGVLDWAVKRRTITKASSILFSCVCFW